MSMHPSEAQLSSVPRGRLGALLLLLLATLFAAPAAWAQIHDLVLDDATDVTSANPADHLSPDIKVGADFGDTSVADEVRRGVVNPVYGRFYVNGTGDQALNSGDVQLLFHWRTAAPGETPPAGSDPSWTAMSPAALPVTFAPTDPVPFLIITSTWPTNYPSVTARNVEWTPPTSGDLFHVRAEAVYPAGVTDNNPGDNVAVSLYDSVAGLVDVDVLIVHDLSGSMLSFQYLGDSYLDHAIARARAFALSMTGSHRVAVVGFGGCLSGNTADVWPTPTASLQTALPNQVAVSNAIQGLTIPHAGCGTPMGPGLERALQVFSTSAAASGHKKAILLLTDGYDNTGSPRACSGSGSDPCLTSPVLADLQSDDVRVFSIALGAAAWQDCVECLTRETGGQYYSPAGPGLDLAEVYLHMQQDYSADDLYRADRGVTGSQNPDYETHFDGRDEILYFVLASDRLDAEIGLELRPPGDGWQAAGAVPGSRVSQGRGFTVVQVRGAVAGTWGYRVVGEERQSYLVAVRSDTVEEQLRLRVKSEGRVGEPIHLAAWLSKDGKPVTAQRMTATVTAPTVALDRGIRRAVRHQLLQRGIYPVDKDRLRGTDFDPRSAFLHQLTQGQPHRLAGNRKSHPVELKRNEDGTYTGVFRGSTLVAGDYVVTVTHRGEKADREMSRTVRLRTVPKVNFETSFAELYGLEREGIHGTRWLARIYLSDKPGNPVVDPSLLRELRLEVEGAQPVSEPEIAFDGAVEVWFKATSNEAPKLATARLGRRELKTEGPPLRFVVRPPFVRATPPTLNPSTP